MKNAFKISMMLLLVALSACGFHPRGSVDVPFKSVYIQGSTLVVSKELVRNFKLRQVKVLPSSDGADLQLELIGEESEKRILSLSGTGVVREYELYYRVHYRTKTVADSLWSAEQTVEARRDFSYSDANLLGKQAEEKRLIETMQRDVMNGLLRRLSALKF